MRDTFFDGLRDFVFRVFVILTIALVLASIVRADPKDAVVRIPSHGGSGTVIATGKGWSLILSAGHCFEKEAARKAITVDAPFVVPVSNRQDISRLETGSTKVGVELLAHECDDSTIDLSLIRVNYGPLPYVAPVAPAGFNPGACLSIGYDEMALPGQVRPASIVGYRAGFTYTKERPWHGRSGGALIDRNTGYLVGVVSGYTGPRNHQELDGVHRGVYASHHSILSFLKKCKAISYEDAPCSPKCPNGQCPRAFEPNMPNVPNVRFALPEQWLPAPSCPNGQCPRR
jgi:hypothetical protein